MEIDYSTLPLEALLTALDPLDNSQSYSDPASTLKSHPFYNAGWEEVYRRLLEAAIHMWNLYHMSDTMSYTAADIAADIFIELFHPVRRTQSNLLDKVRSARNPDAYLRKVIKYRIWNKVREHSRRVQHARLVPELETAPPPKVFEQQEISEFLQQAIKRLRPIDRGLLEGKIAGLPLQRLSEMTGLKPGAVAVRLTRAMRRLGQDLESVVDPKLLSDGEFADFFVARLQEFLKKKDGAM